MQWVSELFGAVKPIIAMCHLRALPGDPAYDMGRGVAWVLEEARHDLQALQAGGVDAVMFSNEHSLPYLLKVEPITYVATGASFVREIFTGVYASDFGLWNTNCGEVVRHQHAIGGQAVKRFYNIVPEAAVYLAQRDIAAVARSTVFNTNPDAICVSGLIAGAETSQETLSQVKSAIPTTPVFANTGVKLENVAAQLAVADGAVVGTTFKRDGYIWNPVDESRVKAFMGKVKELRNN